MDDGAKPLNSDELKNLLEKKQLREIKIKISELNENDIAAFLEELDTEKATVVFRLLPKDLATDVFACTMFLTVVPVTIIKDIPQR